MHVHIVLRCGAKTVLFTNKLSECWCCIINPYIPVYKVSYIRYESYKNMHVLCCGAKGCCLPTSYQNFDVISVIPTCL